MGGFAVGVAALRLNVQPLDERGDHEIDEHAAYHAQQEQPHHGQQHEAQRGAFLAFLAGGCLARLLGPRSRPWLHTVSDLFAAVVCAFLVGAGWTFISVGLDPKAVLFLGIRQTWAALIVPAGFLLMALQFVLRAVQGVGKIVRGEADEEPAAADAQTADGDGEGHGRA